MKFFLNIQTATTKKDKSGIVLDQTQVQVVGKQGYRPRPQVSSQIPRVGLE